MAFSHSPKIVTDGLILCVDAGDKNSYPGSGTTWSDLSGNGNDVTLSGATFDSNFKGSFDFDGSNDVGETGSNIGISGTNSRTFDFWCNVHGDQQRNIVAMGGNGNSALFETMVYTGGGYLQAIGHYYGSGMDTLSSLPSKDTVNVNEWNHIVHMYNGSSVSIYTNGVFSNAKSLSLNTSDSVVRIGRNVYTPSNYFNGNISSLKIYNKALTESEVLQNYNAQRIRFGV